MYSAKQIHAYTWLINTIREAGEITFNDISDIWQDTEMSGGLPLSRTTFNRHREGIMEMFGIRIECGEKFRYHIANESVLRENTLQNWMLNTLSVNNIIAESMSLQNRIFMETVPDDRYLETMVKAMKEGRCVKIKYQKYGSAEWSQRVIEPYFLKQDHRRWYVMANTSNGNRLFAFDRILSVELSDSRYKMPRDFNPKAYFSDCYGVIRDERIPAERIVIRANGIGQNYMLDLPLHHTQRVIGQGNGYTDFEMHLRPTVDFIGYIMSQGTLLKVLEPQSLADTIKANLQKTIDQYE